MSQNPIRTTKPVSLSLKREVLAEAGYRCAVPTCRSILAIDMHHILEVRAGGPHTLSNLLALCPTCHALSTRGTISREAIHAWKTMLVSLSHAFDQTAINHLLFLRHMQNHPLLFSSDGVVPFAPLIAADLAQYHLVSQDSSSARYTVQLTAKGTHLLEAWCSGDREAVKLALSPFV